MSSSFEFPELTGAPGGAEPGAEDAEAKRAAAEAARLEAAREEGFEAGRAAGRAELAAAAEAAAAATRALQAERAAAARAVEQAAAELAVRVAEKVVAAALEVRPELVLDVVRGALRRLVEPQEAILLVNPEDAELVRGAIEELAGGHGAPLTVRAERRVERGGCLLRTQAGEVDARIGGQLERATALVTAELGG